MNTARQAGARCYRVMVIGESWHGSNCTGLARGFRELGHVVDLIGVDRFFPQIDRSICARALQALLSPFYVQQFNRYVLSQARTLRPVLVVVYKGNYVRPSTLNKLRAFGAWVSNYYPDVSFMCHGPVDVETFPIYDHIFTTKSFGVEDFRQKLGLTNVSLLPHGFDPHVHRPILGIPASEMIDASFIGTWSPHKENILASLAEAMPDLRMRIWGSYWERAKSPQLARAIVGRVLSGDYYAEAIGRSLINLGLLSEIRPGASSGDKITSRTFHIPACGGFMLHERTDELLSCYREDSEVACFSTADEAVERVHFYLHNEKERLAIAQAGYQRCIRENSLTERASVIIDEFERQRIRLTVDPEEVCNVSIQ